MNIFNRLLRFLSVLILSVVIQDVHSKSHGQSSFSNLGVLNGKNTTIEQHPYMVVIMCPNDFFVCGGTIISPRFILSGAQCLEAPCAYHPINTVHVRVGSTFSNHSGTVYTAKRLEWHPLYGATHTYDYDVGIIELERDIPRNGKTAKAISLPPLGSAPIPAGTNIIILGWGHDRDHLFPITNHLREATLPTITTEECAKIWDEQEIITPRMFCAESQGDECASDYGDRGGPAVDSATGVQLGIISFMDGCPSPEFPGGFTNLTDPNMRKWIKHYTGV